LEVERQRKQLLRVVSRAIRDAIQQRFAIAELRENKEHTKSGSGRGSF
jgi:hypothetical protein